MKLCDDDHDDSEDDNKDNNHTIHSGYISFI
jgi:hypothetical protein